MLFRLPTKSSNKVKICECNLENTHGNFYFHLAQYHRWGNFGVLRNTRNHYWHSFAGTLVSYTMDCSLQFSKICTGVLRIRWVSQMAMNIWQNLLSTFSAVKKTTLDSSEKLVITNKSIWSNNAKATILTITTVKSSNLVWYSCVNSYFSIGPHAEHHTHQSWSHGYIQLYCWQWCASCCKSDFQPWSSL